jgi:hypothetical protein
MGGFVVAEPILFPKEFYAGWAPLVGKLPLGLSFSCLLRYVIKFSLETRRSWASWRRVFMVWLTVFVSSNCVFRISFSFLSSLTSRTYSSIPCCFYWIICSCWSTTELFSLSLCLFCFPSLRVFSIIEFPLLISSMLCFNLVSIFSICDLRMSLVSDIYLFWSWRDCCKDCDLATSDSLSLTSRCND